MLRIRRLQTMYLLGPEDWAPAQQVVEAAGAVVVALEGFSVAVVEVEVRPGDLQEVL
jgi:hypothetical protein